MTPAELQLVVEMALRVLLGSRLVDRGQVSPLPSPATNIAATSRRPCDSPRCQGPEVALRALDQILGIAIDACIGRRLLDASTLPILLLEDAVDALPLSACEAAWGVFEAHKDALVDTLNGAQKWRNPLLRCTTALMKRLSRVRGAGWRAGGKGMAAAHACLPPPPAADAAHGLPGAHPRDDGVHVSADGPLGR